MLGSLAVLLDAVLDRRLVVLSGKGGVGKSVVGLSLALAARNRGKRVLLVEVSAPLEAARYLGRPPAGTREREAIPGLHTLNLDPTAVMDEYVRQTVRIDMLARRILESPVYSRFFAAAPGLKDLMLLGKVMVLEEARDRFSRRPRYDLIVLDAPATGHGLSLLKVPIAASEAVPIGPVGHNARRILRLLRDEKKTALVIVAVPEEMAVVEAVEFHAQAVDELRMPPSLVVLNGCHERRFREAEEAEVLRLAAQAPAGRLRGDVPLAAALLAGRRQIRRRKLTRFYEARLQRAIDLPLVRLPFLFREVLDERDLLLLASRLEAA